MYDPNTGINIESDISSAVVGANSLQYVSDGVNFSGLVIQNLKEKTGLPKMTQVIKVTIPSIKLLPKKTEYGTTYSNRVACALDVQEYSDGVAQPNPSSTRIFGQATIGFNPTNASSGGTPVMSIGVVENNTNRSRMIGLGVVAAPIPTASPSK